MAVTRNDIIDSLRGKENLLDSDDWRRVVEQYPYCEIFVWHYLRALYRAEDVSFDSELNRLGLRLGDKQGFYNFMVRRPSSESLFSYQTATSDYFAQKSQESLSLTELARKLRVARLAAADAQKESFCKPEEQKNDIPDAPRTPETTVQTPSDEVKKPVGESLIPPATEESVSKTVSQTSDSLSVIRAQITTLIMRKKYSEALAILKRENFANSKKNAYFAVQIKYLETIINNK